MKHIICGCRIDDELYKEYTHTVIKNHHICVVCDKNLNAVYEQSSGSIAEKMGNLDDRLLEIEGKITNKITKLRQNVQNLQEQRSTIKNQNNLLIADLESRINGLELRLQKKRNDNDIFQESNKNLQIQVDEALSKIEELEKEVSNSIIIAKEALGRETKIKNLKNKLVKSDELLQIQANEALIKIKELDQEALVRERKIKDLNDEFEESNKKLKNQIETENELVQLQVEYNSLLTTSRKMNKDFISLQNSNNDIVDRNSKLQDKIDNRQSQVQQIRKEYSEILQNPTHKEHKLVKSYLMGLSYAEN